MEKNKEIIATYLDLYKSEFVRVTRNTKDWVVIKLQDPERLLRISVREEHKGGK